MNQAQDAFDEQRRQLLALIHTNDQEWQFLQDELARMPKDVRRIVHAVTEAPVRKRGGFIAAKDDVLSFVIRLAAAAWAEGTVLLVRGDHQDKEFVASVDRRFFQAEEASRKMWDALIDDLRGMFPDQREKITRLLAAPLKEFRAADVEDLRYVKIMANLAFGELMRRLYVREAGRV